MSASTESLNSLPLFSARSLSIGFHTGTGVLEVVKSLNFDVMVGKTLACRTGLLDLVKATSCSKTA